MHCPLKQFISNNEAAPIQFLLPPLSAVPHHYTNCRIYSARKTYPANKLNSFNLWLKYHQGDQGLYFFMYFLENWSAATLTFAMKVDSANCSQELHKVWNHCLLSKVFSGLSFNVFFPFYFTFAEEELATIQQTENLQHLSHSVTNYDSGFLIRWCFSPSFIMIIIFFNYCNILKSNFFFFFNNLVTQILNDIGVTLVMVVLIQVCIKLI